MAKIIENHLPQLAAARSGQKRKALSLGRRRFHERQGRKTARITNAVMASGPSPWGLNQGEMEKDIK